MAHVTTYLNFNGNAEQAFLFYAEVFGTSFQNFTRFEAMADVEGMPTLSEALKSKIMHVSLPILGGHLLQGTDAPEEMGFKVIVGNNVHISLYTDSKEQLDNLFVKLSIEGKVEHSPAGMFWGSYFASFTDKFGIHWMLNFPLS
ncbi:MAG: VOC family protein [Leadbetterella sp.]